MAENVATAINLGATGVDPTADEMEAERRRKEREECCSDCCLGTSDGSCFVDCCELITEALKILCCYHTCCDGGTCCACKCCEDCEGCCSDCGGCGDCDCNCAD